MRSGTVAALMFGAALSGAAGGVVAQRYLPLGNGGDGAGVRDYLLAHPEILPEAMQRLQAREAGRAVDANRAAIVDPFPGAIAGNPKGDVTVVAFMDYACGYCRASLPALAELIETDPKVRVVYRELPILSPASRTAAEWALAAAGQGRFKPFHDALYAAGRVDDATIAAAARTAGLDMAAAQTAAASAPVRAEIERNLRTAGVIGITGTPTWVVGDQVLGGLQTLEGLQAAVASVRKPAG